jgi:hypothetical protein
VRGMSLKIGGLGSQIEGKLDVPIVVPFQAILYPHPVFLGNLVHMRFVALGSGRK